MVRSTRYFDLVREMKDACNHRLRLVESAKQSGIKPTARLFASRARRLPEEAPEFSAFLKQYIARWAGNGGVL